MPNTQPLGIIPTTIYGSGTSDYIEYVAGPVEVWTRAGYDEIITGEYNDTIDPGTGNSRIYSGKGDDIIHAESASGLYLAGNYRSGEGQDSVYGGEIDEFISDTTGDDNDFLSGGGGNDTIASGNGDDFLIGGDGKDRIGDTGTSLGNDTIDGGNGDDAIFSGYGHDSILGGDGDDWIHDGEGNDIIYAGNGSDAIRSGWGDDFVSGDAGNDIIRVDAGNDTVYGDSGHDQIYGSGGNDMLFGDGGDDFISDFSGDNLLIGGRGFDHIVSGDGADKIHGLEGSDTLMGGNGNDTIIGGDNSTDWMDDIPSAQPGPIGRDRIYGQGGDDVLQALEFGATSFAPVEFFYTGSDGNDRILDFTIREQDMEIEDYLLEADTIVISRNINNSGIYDHDDLLGRISDTAAGALIDLGGNNSILIENVTVAQLTYSAFYEDYFDFV